MVRDPLTRWDNLFPYDVLAFAGITPDSTIAEIRDASFDLMARNEMTPEVRQAWDDLRIASRRVVVDFFLYQIDVAAELATAGSSLEEVLQRWAEPPDPGPLLAPDPTELEELEEEFRAICLAPADIQFLPEFDQATDLLIDDPVVFDR